MIATVISAFSTTLYVTGIGTSVTTTVLLSDGNILIYYPVNNVNNSIIYAWRKLPAIPDISTIPILGTTSQTDQQKRLLAKVLRKKKVT